MHLLLLPRQQAKEGNAFDAFGSSDQFNSNSVNDGFEASIGENAFEAFDEADSNNDKGKSNFNSPKNDDGFNVPDDTAFEDNAFSNATDSNGDDGFGYAEDAFAATGDALPRETTREISRHWRQKVKMLIRWMMKMSLMTHLVLFRVVTMTKSNLIITTLWGMMILFHPSETSNPDAGLRK